VAWARLMNMTGSLVLRRGPRHRTITSRRGAIGRIQG
jgi:hypothetical protein